MEGGLLGIGVGHDVAVHVAARREGVQELGVYGLDGGAEVALEDAVKLEGLARGDLEGAVGVGVGEGVEGEPLRGRADAAGDADAGHEGEGFFFVLLTALVAEIAVVLRVDAVEFREQGTVLGDGAGGGIGEVAEDVAAEEVALGFNGLVFDERFRRGGRGRREGGHGGCGGIQLGKSMAERGGQGIDGIGMGADEVGEVATQGGIFGFGGAADLRDVAAGTGVAAGRKEEQSDDDRAGIEAGGAELVGKERLVVRVLGAFHRGSDDGADGIGEEQADDVGDLIAQRGGGGRWAAVVHDDHGRGGESAGGDRLANAGGDDFWNHVGVGETRGEGEGKRRGGRVEFLEIRAEGGADGALGADEKWDENEVAFAGGELRSHPREQGPCGGVTVEGGERDAVAVFPRNGMNRHADGSGELGGDGAEVERRGGFEGTVVDEDDGHEVGVGIHSLALAATAAVATGTEAASNHASFPESAATSPITTMAGAPKPACSDSMATRSSVVRSWRCWPVVADWMTATGVVPTRPPTWRRRVIVSRFFMPM